ELERLDHRHDHLHRAVSGTCCDRARIRQRRHAALKWRHRSRTFPTHRHGTRRWRGPAAQATLTVRPGGAQMIDLAHIDDLARRLSALVPPALREGREDMQQNFKTVLQSGLSRLDLVTREEFEVQRAVLARTRDKLESLERQLAELEARQSGAAPGTGGDLPHH